MTIYPFRGGSTSFRGGSTSFFGLKLGEKTSDALVFSGGPAMAALSSSVLLISGRLTEEKHPQISSCLKVCSYMDFANHFRYALSALYDDSPGHDFADLNRLIGFHPLAAAAAFAALPILINKFYDALSQKPDIAHSVKS